MIDRFDLLTRTANIYKGQSNVLISALHVHAGDGEPLLPLQAVHLGQGD